MPKGYPNKPMSTEELIGLTPEAIDCDIQNQLCHVVEVAIVFIENIGGAEAAKELRASLDHQRTRMAMQSHNREAIARILKALAMETPDAPHAA